MNALKQTPRRPRDLSDVDEASRAPLGCGWFDSSHDLRDGLRVHELVTPQAQAAALPLACWLDIELAACAPAAR